jgi:Domain of unknown function (DUF1905)/Bacteriocin-protection, YdeI or OmpD-Associated
MIRFSAIIQKFEQQGEKSGWTYIEIPESIAQQIKPRNKKSFRVKGKLDSFAISSTALIPMGEGNFIMAFNAAMRKGTGKRKGATLDVQLEEDKDPVLPPAELIECLADEPKAQAFYNSLTQGHKNYFTKWIETAKTDATKTKRIAESINALSKKMDFGAMLRALKADRQTLKK